MLKRNLDKIMAGVVATVFVGAVIFALVVWLRVRDEEVKDWPTFNFAVTTGTIGLVALFFSMVTLLMKVWDSMEKVDLRIEWHEINSHRYPVIVAQNRGMVLAAHRDHAELRLDDGVTEKIKLVEGNGKLGAKEAAIFCDEHGRAMTIRAAKKISIIVRRPDGSVLARLTGPRVREAMLSEPYHNMLTGVREGRLG